MDYLRKIEKEMVKEIIPYDTWFDDGSRNTEAQNALISFYYKYQKCKVSKNYAKKNAHFDYVRHLLNIKQAFEANLLCRACNEIRTLIHFEPFTQPRIKENLLSLLSQHLGV